MEIKKNTRHATVNGAAIPFAGMVNNIPDHGNEIEEIISSKQPFVVRWGILLLFILIMLTALTAWLIQYPDLVLANGVLNSINAPKEVVAKTEGKLVRFFPQEGQEVKKGTVLGYLESTADHSQIIYLSLKLDTLSWLAQTGAVDKLPGFLHLSFNNLGELQGSFQVYRESLREFSDYLKNGFYLRKKKMLREDIGFLKQSQQVLLYQKDLLAQDILLADSTFRANERLKQEKVISEFDYRAEKSKLITKHLTEPQAVSSIINNESLQHEKQKEIAELENKIMHQQETFIQSLNTFKSQVEEWKMKYLLLAPVDGKISFAAFLQENQQVKAGQLICFVNPENSSYFVEARIPQYNFGKVKDNQEVLLKFTAYPYREFGIVKGRISAINSIPTDSGYYATITMPNGLITTYKKEIQYRSGLSVQTEIITKRKRLLERLFENFAGITGR